MRLREVQLELRWSTAWDSAGAQLPAAQGRSVEVRMIAAGGCAAAQQRTAHGRSMLLRKGAAWGCAGDSVKLRWAAAAVEGAQHVTQQRALNVDCAAAAREMRGNARRRSMGPRRGAA